MSKFVIEPVRRRVPYLRGRFKFTLVADNGEVVATSETYNNRVNCREGIAALKHAAETAIVVER